MGKRHGTGEAVAKLPEQAERPLVARDGPDGLTKMQMRIAQAVPDVRLKRPFAEVAAQVEGMPTVSDGLLIMTELAVVPAHGVASQGDPAAVIGRFEQRQALPGVIQSPVILPLPAKYMAEIQVNPGLADVVVSLPVQVKSLLQMGVHVVGGAERETGMG